MAQIIWLMQIKATHLHFLAHHFLDGHLPPIIWQPEGMAASQGEIQADVCYKV